MSWIPSASQTVGPFFNFALTSDPTLGVVAKNDTAGERLKLTFRVTDGDGTPTPGDSMLELWQADSQGRYSDCFGRLETCADGTCAFDTVKPGRVDGQAPHINVTVFARGLLKHLYTRVYFAGDAANDADAVLALVPAERRYTLLAKPVAGELSAWHFEIRLQGEAETVFFDL